MRHAEQNLILAGFMGTGKTTVGRLVARVLGRPFLDLDDELEREFGRPIADVFAEEGEAAFRAAESRLCRALVPKAGLVVGTGGGAVVDPANREALATRGVLICLEADPRALAARLAGTAGQRPMLAPDPETAIARLLDKRALAYAAIPLHVDTTGLSPEAVAERVVALYRQGCVAEVRA